MTERSFIIMLIESVERNPCLWDTASVEYGKRDRSEKAWADIAAICGKPVKYCREKWKNVRTGFLRSLREYPEANMTSKRRRFYLYDNMQFLLPPILRHDERFMSDRTQANCKTERDDHTIVKIEDSSNSDILDYDELDQCDATGACFVQFDGLTGSMDAGSENSRRLMGLDEPPPMKRCRSSDEQLRESKEELALMSFFRGITSDVLSLSMQRQRFFKRKIVELVDDLHREDEDEAKREQCEMYQYCNSSPENRS